MILMAFLCLYRVVQKFLLPLHHIHFLFKSRFNVKFFNFQREEECSSPNTKS
jgi:hypothetical protein